MEGIFMIVRTEKAKIEEWFVVKKYVILNESELFWGAGEPRVVPRHEDQG